MSKEAKTEITRVSQEAWRTVQKLTESIANSPPPVSLDEFAKGLGIRCIRFKPLLSDAGLSKSGENWEIVINTEHRGITVALRTRQSLDVGNWSELTRSLRFTTAHELAHLAFLKAANQDSQSELFRRNEKAIENGCNILARIFLLPRQMLIREIANRLFDVDHVCEILSSFQVSPEVFIRRLHLSDVDLRQSKGDGFLAFAHEEEGTIRVKACHILGTYGKQRFHQALQLDKNDGEISYRHRSLSADYKQAKWALEGSTLDDVKLDKNKKIESALRNADRGQLELLVGLGEGNIIPCEFVFRRLDQKHRSLLIRLQVIGPVQKAGERTILKGA
jgi:hypothetical protein